MEEYEAEKAIEKVLAHMRTPEFREQVRKRITKENEQFREEDISLRTSRRQYLQTYDL